VPQRDSYFKKYENFPNSEIIDGVIHMRIKGYFSKKTLFFIEEKKQVYGPFLNIS
jgi:hypothetical protein